MRRNSLVGVEVPLSGALARVGTGMHEGISVAADVFNRKNGKHKIKLITIDDESSPAKAVAAVEKLASQGVVAIDGGYGSGNIGPASDAANKAGLVYITSGGVDEALTQRGFKTFFRINNTAGLFEGDARHARRHGREERVDRCISPRSRPPTSPRTWRRRSPPRASR